MVLEEVWVRESPASTTAGRSWVWSSLPRAQGRDSGGFGAQHSGDAAEPLLCQGLP